MKYFATLKNGMTIGPLISRAALPNIAGPGFVLDVPGALGIYFGSTTQIHPPQWFENWKQITGNAEMEIVKLTPLYGVKS